MAIFTLVFYVQIETKVILMKYLELFGLIFVPITFSILRTWLKTRFLFNRSISKKRIATVVQYKNERIPGSIFRRGAIPYVTINNSSSKLHKLSFHSQGKLFFREGEEVGVFWQQG